MDYPTPAQSNRPIGQASRSARAWVHASALVLATAGLMACGGESALGEESGDLVAAGGSDAGDGGGDLIIENPGSGGGSSACAAQTLETSLVKTPVDLIVVVDTSATMKPASTAVEENINQNLAAALTGVDYRLIVLADYGTGNSLCVSPPLGGADCAAPPEVPANTANFFHYSAMTGSKALLSNVVKWYNTPDALNTAPSGWSAWLRPDALKVFLVFTDSSAQSLLTSKQFDDQLLAVQPALFGTAADRQYVFHSIVGLGQNEPATSAWEPSDALVTQTCSGYSGSLGAGAPFQETSILTGGLRFPICEFANFDVVFQTIAKDVVSSAPIACDIPFPAAGEGDAIDPNTVELIYTPGDGGSAEKLSQAADASACDLNKFWIEGESIHLCPESCERVNATDGNSVDVRFGCDVGFVK